MKIALEIKNMKKAIKPSKDSIIIHDGKDWYITTKQDLFREYDDKFQTKLDECDEKIAEMNEALVKIAKQILDIEEIVRNKL